jgi:MFS family permease
MMAPVFRLALALFLMQAGFHSYTASMPVALARGGVADAEIGVIVGIAALVQIPAALVAGVLIDWFGGIRLFLAGGVAYVAASLLLLLPGVEVGASPVPFVVARVLQGIGIGIALPAALSVVPRLVSAARQGVALAFGGVSFNLTLVVAPPLSLIVLDLYGLDGVALFALAAVAVAFGLTLARPFQGASAPDHGTVSLRSGLRFRWRNSWAAPMLITLLYSAHWGLVVAYLPQRAEAAAANVGLFFAADGLGVLLGRVPAGWLADRSAPLWPMLAGIAATAAGVVLLLLEPTTGLLMVAGALTGSGAALITTPILVALSRRSSDADRGSAFALFSAAFALALAIGSVGAAPVIDQLGFVNSLAVLLVALLMSALVAAFDRRLRLPGSVAMADVELVAVPPAS